MGGQSESVITASPDLRQKQRIGTVLAKYADVVLPVTTHWERWGGISCGNSGHGGNREILIYYRQVTEPLYEAKDDYWIERELAKRWGIDPDLVDPLPLNQRLIRQELRIC